MTLAVEETYTIDQFIVTSGVTVECTPVPENPNMVDMVKGTRHFHCVLRKGDRHMTTYYSVGPGIVQQWLETAKIVGWPRRPYPPASKRSLMYEQFFLAHCNKYRPELADLLDCLASDANGIENARSFEEWADEYGYDTDSIKAERTYNACRDSARALQTMLGREAFETLLWNTERQ